MLLIYPGRVWDLYTQVNTNNINKTSAPYKQQGQRWTEHRIYAKIVMDITTLKKERKDISYDKKLDTTIRKDNVNKTLTLLQTNGDKDIVLCRNLSTILIFDFGLFFWSNVFQLPGSRRLSLPFAITISILNTCYLRNIFTVFEELAVWIVDLTVANDILLATRSGGQLPNNKQWDLDVHMK